MRFALALALAFAAVVCLPLSSLAAQDAEPIGPGTRIRVVSVAEGTSRRVVGTVIRVDSAGVAIARGGGREAQLARGGILTVERSTGRRPEVVKGAVTGALLAGGVFLARALIGASMEPSWELEECSARCVAGTVGLLVGAGVLGAYLDPTEQWAPVPAGALWTSGSAEAIIVGLSLDTPGLHAGVRAGF